MTKIVQLAGGSANQQNGYTGPARELTVDESNGDLRLHDGATPGGKLILNRNNNDERYQAKNSELDGLTGFLPEMKGFFVRLGPGDYILRSLAVNGANMNLTYSNGYVGNPTFSLAESITSDHTWTGEHVYSQTVTFLDGIEADVAGDTNGTHTGPVTGDVTGNLTGNSTGTHTGPTIGAVDARGETLLLDDDQIPMTKIDGLEEALTAVGNHLGFIMLWSGAIVDIPAGWSLCNGLGGTPDLRKCFVIGANDSDLPPGSEGGALVHDHTWTHSGDGDHDHGITVDGHTLTTAEIPTHSHKTVANISGAYNTAQTYPDSAINRGATGGSGGSSYDLGAEATYTAPTLGKSSETGSGGSHSHDLTISGDGSHSHTLTTPESDHLPPYYALCYIMRTS